MISIYSIFIITILITNTSTMYTDHRCSQTIETFKIYNGEIIKYNTSILKCCEGYRYSPNTLNSCEPICNPKCPQSFICTKPQTCECFDETPQGDKCEPQCDDRIYRFDFEINQCVLKNCSCSNNGGGYCLSDYNDCICYEGFHLTYDNHCEPECQEQCENADCVGPNQCECWLDYHATANPNVCEPNDLCQLRLCENGECLLTGECKCKKGFAKSLTIKGQIICQTIPEVIAKIMSLIVAVPLFLAFIVLLVVYIIARHKNGRKKNNQGVRYDAGIDITKVTYNTSAQLETDRPIYAYDNDISI